jgi:hypothetical protein
MGKPSKPVLDRVRWNSKSTKVDFLTVLSVLECAWWDLTSKKLSKLAVYRVRWNLKSKRPAQNSKPKWVSKLISSYSLRGVKLGIDEAL